MIITDEEFSQTRFEVVETETGKVIRSGFQMRGDAEHFMAQQLGGVSARQAYYIRRMARDRF